MDVNENSIINIISTINRQIYKICTAFKITLMQLCEVIFFFEGCHSSKLYLFSSHTHLGHILFFQLIHFFSLYLPTYVPTYVQQTSHLLPY